MYLIGRLKSGGGASWHISVYAHHTDMLLAVLTGSCDRCDHGMCWPNIFLWDGPSRVWCFRKLAGVGLAYWGLWDKARTRTSEGREQEKDTIAIFCTNSLKHLVQGHFLKLVLFAKLFLCIFLNVWHCILYNATYYSRLECFLPWIYWYVLYVCCILWILQELMHKCVN